MKKKERNKLQTKNMKSKYLRKREKNRISIFVFRLREIIKKNLTLPDNAG